MSQELEHYIEEAKEKNISDEEIKHSLLEQGWSEVEIQAALEGKPIPPKPDSNRNSATEPIENKAPIPVMESGYTKNGFEYSLFVFSLGLSAFALAMVLHANIGGFASGLAGFFATTLVVAVPLTLFFGSRVKKADLANPSLKEDKSRRRTGQHIMGWAFGIGILRIIFYLYELLNGGIVEPTQTFLNVLVTVLIAGSVFVYFWKQQNSS